MSIGEIFDEWRIEGAELLSTDIRGATYQQIDVIGAAEQAKEILGLQIPDGEDYFVPLLEITTPEPSHEYVLYRPERESIGWFDAGFGGGVKRFYGCEKLNDTEIGHRMRFWLPEKHA